MGWGCKAAEEKAHPAPSGSSSWLWDTETRGWEHPERVGRAYKVNKSSF